MKQQDTTNQITLTFPNLSELWKFAQTLSSHNLEINTRLHSLTCYCSEADIKRAASKFGASVLQSAAHSN